VPPPTYRTPLPAQAAEYVPRRPQDTVLHRLVRERYETFVAHTEATHAAPLPRYVPFAFERYLLCDDFSHGFVRCHGGTCRHDVLVANSSKQRGLCPSCGARRMCDVAANVTDAILPSAPVRQGVLSLPFELRGLAATKPDVLTARLKKPASSPRRSRAPPSASPVSPAPRRAPSLSHDVLDRA